MNTQAQNPDYPSWLDREDYPFASHYFELPMGRMHYVDEGGGEPIVMLHGNPGWSFEYRNIIKAMSSTHRCIAPDLIGFGLSDKPDDWDYLPISHAHNIELFLDSLDLPPFTLVVNDWGGPIGLSYAIRHPERIRRILILNTWMWSVADDPYYRRFSGMMGGSIGRFLIRNFNIFGRLVVPRAMGDSSQISRHTLRQYYLPLATPRDRKGCYVFPREIIGSSDWLDSLWQHRSAIDSLPTSIIWGMKDIAFREQELDRWIQNWHDPTVIRLPEVGHFPQEEAPEIVITELQRY